MAIETIKKVTSSTGSLPPTLLDLTNDTVNSENLSRDETAHNNEGYPITGQMSIEEAEAWAVGTKEGIPVAETDIQYQNNAKYYSIVSGSIMRIAGQQAIAAATSANNAASSASDAADSAVISGSCMRTAGEYKDEAVSSASTAEEKAEDSEAWAVGKRNGTDVTPSDPTYHNNSKYWADQAKAYGTGGVHYIASVLFENIPVSGMASGDMYNIEDDFTTDERFQEGAGVKVKAGANIIYNAYGKWDVEATGGGTGSNFLGIAKKWLIKPVAERKTYQSADIVPYRLDKYAVEFGSDEPFTLRVRTPAWDGTMEYSLDGLTWATWDGTELAGDDDHPIWLRGNNNTVLTGVNGFTNNHSFRFTGKYIEGELETLLDWQTVVQGQHPTMSADCCEQMFYNCSKLVFPPKLSSVTLADYCYTFMFTGCSSLKEMPKLPAITLADCCYFAMFSDCTSLETVYELPATTITQYCYSGMFSGCTALKTLIKLPALNIPGFAYNGMFEDCSNIKLSETQTGIYQYKYSIPTEGTGTGASNSTTHMIDNTGGTFTGKPLLNTVYYTDHEPI